MLSRTNSILRVNARSTLNKFVSSLPRSGAWENLVLLLVLAPQAFLVLLSLVPCQSSGYRYLQSWSYIAFDFKIIHPAPVHFRILINFLLQ